MQQEDLIDRAHDVLIQDSRVLGVWLAGSFARGTQDPYSDVDLWVVVDPDDLAGFIQDWPKVAEEIAPTVLRQQLGNFPIFNQVTADWLRFDISIGTPADIAERTRSTVKPLYDPGDLSAGLSDQAPPLQPDPRRVAALGQEFMRVLGLLPVVVGRSEFVVGASGAHLLRTMLIQLMVEDVAVEDRGGALHLTALLPPERLRALTNLPPISATRDAVIAAHLSCAEIFLPLARDLYARCDLPWPAELEAALRSHLEATLSLELRT
jgi:predicted nucleotidyltransferase